MNTSCQKMLRSLRSSALLFKRRKKAYFSRQFWAVASAALDSSSWVLMEVLVSMQVFFVLFCFSFLWVSAHLPLPFTQLSLPTRTNLTHTKSPRLPRLCGIPMHAPVVPSSSSYIHTHLRRNFFFFLLFSPAPSRPPPAVAFLRSWPPCDSHWVLLASGTDCPPFLCALPPRQHTPPIQPWKPHMMLTQWP